MRTALYNGGKAEKQIIEKEEKLPSVAVNAGEKDGNWQAEAAYAVQ